MRPFEPCRGDPGAARARSVIVAALRITHRRCVAHGRQSGSLSVGEARNDLSRRLRRQRDGPRERDRAQRGGVARRCVHFRRRGCASEASSRPRRRRAAHAGLRREPDRDLAPACWRAHRQLRLAAAGDRDGRGVPAERRARVRSRLAFAASRFSPASRTANATFASDPADAAPFTTTTRLDSTYHALGAGLQMASTKAEPSPVPSTPATHSGTNRCRPHRRDRGRSRAPTACAPDRRRTGTSAQAS